MRVPKTIAAIAAMASLCGSAQAATKYYARQVLANLSEPSYTYVPTYGAYGACSGGSQTAAITTCTRSDATVVANSMCSPQSKSQTCAPVTCGSLVYHYANTAGTNYYLGNSSTAAAAVAACTTKAQALNLPGACYWNSPTTYFIANGGITPNSGSGNYASTCQ